MKPAIVALENRVMFAEWAAGRQVSSRSLGRAQLLCAVLKLRERLAKTPLLGVVGSKGKGTAATYGSAAVAASGLQVGTILSPGIVSNRERIRIDGRVLPEDDYVSLLNQVASALQKLPPMNPSDGYLSPSGLYMIAGIDYLLQCGCDAIVVEAGMGGVSDEISLFELAFVVVTQIFREHAKILGPGIVEIARNKSGVITKATKAVFVHPQAPAVEAIILQQCSAMHAKVVKVERSDLLGAEDLYPLGFGALNGVAGAAAGLAVAESVTGWRVQPGDLAKVLRTVSYPGRLSYHTTAHARIIIDSAISRDGLAMAINYARQKFGRLPDKIIVSLPSDKDYSGFVAELGGLALERTFVNMVGIHLPYPVQADWPWEWVDSTALEPDFFSGNVLVVGTALFTGFVLATLGINADRLFAV